MFWNFKVLYCVHFINQCTRFISPTKCAKLTIYRGADKSLAQPGRKQATSTEDFVSTLVLKAHLWQVAVQVYHLQGEQCQF